MPIPKITALAPADMINGGNGQDAAGHIVDVRKQQYAELTPAEITNTVATDAIGPQVAFDAFPDAVDVSGAAEIGSQAPITEAQVTMNAVQYGSARNIQ